MNEAGRTPGVTNGEGLCTSPFVRVRDAGHALRMPDQGALKVPGIEAKAPLSRSSTVTFV